MDLSRKTYQMSYPEKTHWRVVSCREFNCEQYMAGWTTTLPVDDEKLGWIRFKSGLRFTETTDGALVNFHFFPEQDCFYGRAGNHRVALHREPVFRLDKNVMEVTEWLDDMQENQHQIGKRRGV